MHKKDGWVRKFVSYYKPYKGLFFADTASSVVVAVIALLLPLGVRYITSDVLEGGMADAAGEIWRVAAVMLGLILVQTGLTFFCDYMGHALGARMERDMRLELFAHYQRLSRGFFDRQRTGQLMSRITNDLLSLAELYHHWPEDLLVHSVKFIGALAILLTINARLTLVICAFLPFMVVYSLLFTRKLKKAYRRSRERIGDVNAQLEDSLAGIRVVQSFANQSEEIRKFDRENQRFFEARKDIYKNEAFYSMGMDAFFKQLMTMAVVIFAGLWIAGGELSLADLLVFMFYVNYLTSPIPSLAHLIQQLQDGLAGFNRFYEMLNIAPEVAQLPDAITPERVEGHVVFEHVGFRYGGEAEDVLRNVNLDVPAGAYVALVGASGAGKTTLCALIPRFYDVTQGRILLDGTDIRKLTLDSLRRSIGVVDQEVYLFAGTVYENIVYGRPGATREEVMEAARRAHAHDFIMNLPHGYDTDIGQRGVQLSGGQRQRLSIARVFLKNPPVLIFDEATSALDNESERIVQESLHSLMQGRTTFVIAHRLSTVRHAQRILVLDDKGIREQGTHEQLINSGGAYARLYFAQG